jgi:hypothetical protein
MEDRRPLSDRDERDATLGARKIEAFIGIGVGIGDDNLRNFTQSWPDLKQTRATGTPALLFSWKIESRNPLKRLERESMCAA